MRRPRDWWVAAGIAVTGTAAAVASFVFLTGLARATGWPPWSAWLLPLTVDALAATALRLYLTCRDRFAGHTAVAAIAASMLGNAASHWFSSGLLTPGWLAVTVVGAVPAISLGLVVHLAATTRPATATYNETAQTLEATPQPVTSVIPVAQPQPPDDLAALIRQTWPDGQYPGLQRMAKQLGVGVPRIRAAKATLNGHGEEQP